MSRRFTKRKSASRRHSVSLESQTGGKNTPRFVSVTTPGKLWYLMDAIAEFVMLQRHGKNLPPYFWYKRVNPQLSDEFYKLKKQLYGMIRRKPDMTALQLLGVILHKDLRQPVEAKIEKPETDQQPDQPALIDLEKEEKANIISLLNNEEEN